MTGLVPTEEDSACILVPNKPITQAIYWPGVQSTGKFIMSRNYFYGAQSSTGNKREDAYKIHIYSSHGVFMYVCMYVCMAVCTSNYDYIVIILHGLTLVDR